MVGGSGAKEAIVEALNNGTFIPSPHGTGKLEHTEATRMTAEDAGVTQTFPFDHPWRGTKTEIGTQIGNAIPPLLAEAILKEATK